MLKNVPFWFTILFGVTWAFCKMCWVIKLGGSLALFQSTRSVKAKHLLVSDYCSSTWDKMDYALFTVIPFLSSCLDSPSVLSIIILCSLSRSFRGFFGIQEVNTQVKHKNVCAKVGLKSNCLSTLVN